MSGFALVTGASSGIGAAYAAQLAARGHDLILVARRRDRLESLAAELRRAHGRKVEIVAADLSHEDDLARIEALIRGRDDIDIVVNNAGLGALGPSASVDAGEVDAMLRVNVLALTWLALAAAPGFARRNRGTLINIASVLAIIPSPGGAAYAASKAYVLHFSRALQAEFAKTDVKVQAVMPGPVRSEFFGDRKAPFPDHMFMSSETLAAAGLAALDAGELISFPTLQDESAWRTFEDARAGLAKAITQSGAPAARYAIA